MIKPTRVPDPTKRVIIIILDGAGIGALPDAHLYGDEGSNTLQHVITKHWPLKLSNLFALGLDKLLDLEPGYKKKSALRACYYGRMSPSSPGKDTTSGHWELAGLVLEESFPLYPNGFPDQVIEAFKKAIGRDVLGNIAASGTEIINDLGEEHLETGYPIVYTSADSVFQVAAHESVVPPEQLYKWCEIARNILTGEHAVGRIIARPFSGETGSFTRTAGRHDYSLPPPGETLLDLVKARGYAVAVIGKVSDIFAHRGVTIHLPGGNNENTAADLFTFINEVECGLIWATFGDFDMLYGHRNDSSGFARALESFDRYLAKILPMIGEGDLLFITADHGCDPTFPSTDHSREYVPVLAWGPSLPADKDLGTRDSFADLAASAAAWLKIDPPRSGKSFI